MAVSVKLSVSVATNSKSLIVKDATGVYDATYNPTGWGAPNPAIATTTAATVAVVMPDGTVIAPINVYPTLPNTNDIGFIITNVMLGLGATDTVPTGKYTFTYTVDGDDGGVYQSIYSRDKFLIGTECCCVSTLAAKVSPEQCKCEDAAMETFSNAWDLLTLAQNSAAGGGLIRADAFIEKLDVICDLADCNCH